MKVNGVEIVGPSEEYLVLPRPGGADLVFHAIAVRDSSPFDVLCPMPKPKPILVKGGWKDNVDDADFITAVLKRDELRVAWMMKESLQNMEWDTVIDNQPSTWLNWGDDLMNAGLTDTEVQRVILCVSTANSLNEGKLEEARESFLAGLAKASETNTGPSSEPPTTQSGTPANG